MELSESGKLSTEFIGSKTEVLVKHIEAFLEELEKVSAMEQELGLQLEELLSIISKKKTEVV